MRQSSKPFTGFDGRVPTSVRCEDYLPVYPLRLVAAFNGTKK
jgi:hypothetical protein